MRMFSGGNICTSCFFVGLKWDYVVPNCSWVLVQGTWRKVTIDDYIPVDAEGNVLLPCSSIPGEIWPMLLAKAICKIMAGYYEVRLDMPEYGEANIVQLLTGWVPETIALEKSR